MLIPQKLVQFTFSFFYFFSQALKLFVNFRQQVEQPDKQV